MRDTAATPVLRAARTVARATAARIERPQTGIVALADSGERGLAELRANTQAAGAMLRNAMLARDSSYVTRSSAAYALFLLEPAAADTVVEVLLQQVRRMSFANIRLARSLLIAMGPAAVPALTRHLNDPMVPGILGAMKAGATGAVPALRDALRGGNVEFAAALAAIGTPEAIAAARPALLGALGEHHSAHVKMVVVAVGQLGRQGEEAVPALRRLLEHADRDVRVYAAVALAHVGAIDEGVTALGNLATDTTVHTRHVALATLGQLGPQARGAVPRLLELARTSDARRFGERAAAAAALQRIAPTDSAVREAIAAASRDPQVRSELTRRGVQVP